MGTQNLYIAKGAGEMINFEKELKNFQPSLEVEEAGLQFITMI